MQHPDTNTWDKSGGNANSYSVLQKPLCVSLNKKIAAPFVRLFYSTLSNRWYSTDNKKVVPEIVKRSHKTKRERPLLLLLLPYFLLIIWHSVLVSCCCWLYKIRPIRLCAMLYYGIYGRTRARARARHMTQKKPSGHSKLLLLLQLYDEEEEEEEEEGKMAAAEQYQGQFFQSWFLVRSDFTAL